MGVMEEEVTTAVGVAIVADAISMVADTTTMRQAILTKHAMCLQPILTQRRLSNTMRRTQPLSRSHHHLVEADKVAVGLVHDETTDWYPQRQKPMGQRHWGIAMRQPLLQPTGIVWYEQLWSIQLTRLLQEPRPDAKRILMPTHVSPDLTL
jgi:hypothetical protein